MDFTNLLTNDESSIVPNEQIKQVKKDYDEFNKTKEDCSVTITRIGYKIFCLILFFIFMFYDVLFTRNLIAGEITDDKFVSKWDDDQLVKQLIILCCCT